MYGAYPPAGGYGAYPPATGAYPPAGGYGAGAYGAGAYGAQPYGAQPYGAGAYGAQPYGAAPYGAQPYGAQPYGAAPVPAAAPVAVAPVAAPVAVAPVAAAPVAVVPVGPINTFVGTPEADADALNRAMVGAGTDDSELIRILGNRTYAQRMTLMQVYQQRHGRSLKDDLHDDTSGNYRKLLKMLVSPRPFVIAECLHKAMAGLGTADYQLLTILTQFDQDMPGVPAAYRQLYGKDLVTEVKRETSGHFEDVLINCILRRPQPPGFVNMATVQADAQAFYRAGEARLGTNDKEYIRIMTTNTNAHLQAVDRAYRQISPKGMMAAIESETSGNYRKALQSLMTPHHRWMAEAVHHAVARPGTEDALLLIVFGLHDKQDLHFIRNEYRTLYQRDMMTDVKSDISGNYERLALTLMA